MIVISILTGLLAGTLSGFLGIGGGILIIPMLIYFLGFSQKMAQGTTLAAMIPPIGLLAAVAYWRAGNINIKVAVLVAAGFLIGGWIGGTFVQYVPDLILKRVFAIFLVLVAVKMWLEK